MRHMNDEWVVGRSAFGGKNLCHCRCVVGVRCQAINGFGRQTQQATGAQRISRSPNGRSGLTKQNHVANHPGSGSIPNKRQAARALA